MAPRTTHSIARGLTRLLHGPRDVETALAVPWRSPSPSPAEATEAHRALFSEYLALLGEAIAFAVELWDGRISAYERRGLDPDAALAAAYAAFFAGPAACPQLVWTLRTHWLKCHSINHASPAPRRIAPQVLLLGWLRPEEDRESIQVITAMPYWPVGLDEHGEWI